MLLCLRRVLRGSLFAAIVLAFPASAGATQIYSAVADTGTAGETASGASVALPKTGTAPVLWVDGDPVRRVYIKFSLAPGSAPAILRFGNVSAASSNPIVVKSASSSWTEASTSLPSPGSTIATSSAIGAGSVSTPFYNAVSIPASAIPAAGGQLTFVLTRTATSRVDVLSREASQSSFRPTLAVG